MATHSPTMSPDAIAEALGDKSPDEVADAMLELNPVLATCTSEQQAAFRKCIKEALALGNILATRAVTPIEQEMARTAIEFEKTLGSAVHPPRMRSDVYPWNWCYRDPEIQKKFHEFCKKTS